jgi:hypothetical protein
MVPKASKHRSGRLPAARLSANSLEEKADAMTIDQVVALLASIGACLSAVATFLTVRQIAKQREASYRPELALSRILFEGSRGPIAEGAIPSFWTKKPEYDESQKELQRLTVPLQNVGLGPRKH